MVAWGNIDTGGTLPLKIAQLNDIVSLSATCSAFAALRADGSVVAWGQPSRGGYVPPEIAKLKDIVSLSASNSAFAALRADGRRAGWGGGDTKAHGEYD